MDDSPLNIDRETWQQLNEAKRRLWLSVTADMTADEKRRRDQRLLAQAAAVHRSILREEPPQPVDPTPGLDT